MLLTPEQLREIRTIIENHHAAFAVNTIGPGVVRPDLLARLQRLGLVNVKINTTADAYLYGQVVAAAENPKAATLSYDQFKAWVRQHPIPLTSVEQDAVAFAQHRAAEYCQGLGNRVALDTGELLIEADAQLRRQMRDEIKTATARNIAERETLQKLKSDLGWATKDWARDWKRIANTETHFAMQRGVAEYIGKRHGSDSRVAVRVMPDACEHCRRLHLGPDDQPRIYELADLEDAGTNVGRKAKDWLPTVPPVHPHCQCQLVRVPDGWGFNEEGQMVPGGELGVEYGKSEALWAMRREGDLREALSKAGVVNYQGIRVRIENPVGSVRHWRDSAGQSGDTLMQCAYGYAERSGGADGDEVDVFLGGNPDAGRVYVVHQRNPYTGLYDEDKVMLGFSDRASAEAAYRVHYTDPDAFLGAVSEMAVDQFRRWLAGTEVPEVEQSLPSLAKLKLVVPLSKATFSGSDAAAGALLGAAGETAQRRAPGQGTSGNYWGGSPDRRPITADAVGFRPTPEEELAGMRADDDDRERWFREVEIYDIPEPLPRMSKVVIPMRHGGTSLEQGFAEANHAHILDIQARLASPTRNTVDLTNSGRLDKALRRRPARRRGTPA